jgi:hypothetical protein
MHIIALLTCITLLACSPVNADEKPKFKEVARTLKMIAITVPEGAKYGLGTYLEAEKVFGNIDTDSIAREIDRLNPKSKGYWLTREPGDRRMIYFRSGKIICLPDLNGDNMIWGIKGKEVGMETLFLKIKQ